MTDLEEVIVRKKEELDHLDQLLYQKAQYPMDNSLLNRSSIVHPQIYLILASTCPRGHRLLITLSHLNLLDQLQVLDLDPIKDEQGDWHFTDLQQARGWPKRLRDLVGSNQQPCLYHAGKQTVLTDDAFHLPELYIRAGLEADSSSSFFNEQVALWDLYLYQSLSAAIYRTASCQEACQRRAYEQGLKQQLFLLDRHLADRSYLIGESFCEADARLWVTLLRFGIYQQQFDLSVCQLTNYPNLLAYCQYGWQNPVIRRVTDLTRICQTHYQSLDNRKKYPLKKSLSIEEAFPYLKNWEE